MTFVTSTDMEPLCRVRPAPIAMDETSYLPFAPSLGCVTLVPRCWALARRCTASMMLIIPCLTALALRPVFALSTITTASTSPTFSTPHTTLAMFLPLASLMCVGAHRSEACQSQAPRENMWETLHDAGDMQPRCAPGMCYLPRARTPASSSPPTRAGPRLFLGVYTTGSFPLRGRGKLSQASSAPCATALCAPPPTCQRPVACSSPPSPYCSPSEPPASLLALPCHSQHTIQTARAWLNLPLALPTQSPAARMVALLPCHPPSRPLLCVGACHRWSARPPVRVGAVVAANSRPLCTPVRAPDTVPLATVLLCFVLGVAPAVGDTMLLATVLLCFAMALYTRVYRWKRSCIPCRRSTHVGPILLLAVFGWLLPSAHAAHTSTARHQQMVQSMGLDAAVAALAAVFGLAALHNRLTDGRDSAGAADGRDSVGTADGRDSVGAADGRDSVEAADDPLPECRRQLAAHAAESRRRGRGRR